MAQDGRQGLCLQQLFRLSLGVLAVAVAASVPTSGRQVCIGVAVAYLAWAMSIQVLTRRLGLQLVRWAWTFLLVDLLATAALTIAALRVDPAPWTSETLAAVLFLFPALATIQLRPALCAMVGALATLTYLGLELTASQVSDPDLTLVATTAVHVALVLTCVTLCRMQRSRVFTLFNLAAERSRHGEEEIDIERRERRILADHLRVHVLQPLKMAHHDLDLKLELGSASRRRVADNLGVASGVLSSALAAMDPRLLEEVGLPAALRQLVTALGPSSGLVLRLNTDCWPDDLRTEADPVLYGAAREFLVGALSHPRSGVVDVKLDVAASGASLQVHDQGAGLIAHLLAAHPAATPLGLASRRSRLEAAGGEVHLGTSENGSTVARVSLPFPTRLQPDLPDVRWEHRPPAHAADPARE